MEEMEFRPPSSCHLASSRVFLNRVVDQVLESCPLQPYCELLHIYPQIQRPFLVVSNFKE